MTSGRGNARRRLDCAVVPDAVRRPVSVALALTSPGRKTAWPLPRRIGYGRDHAVMRGKELRS